MPGPSPRPVRGQNRPCAADSDERCHGRAVPSAPESRSRARMAGRGGAAPAGPGAVAGDGPRGAGDLRSPVGVARGRAGLAWRAARDGRRDVAALYDALAGALCSVGGDEFTAQRQALTGALNTAYDELLTARSTATGLNRRRAPLLGALSASHLMARRRRRVRRWRRRRSFRTTRRSSRSPTRSGRCSGCSAPASGSPCRADRADRRRLVGLAGFEPATSATQTRRASQAALQPVPG
jgi:hypothetical protein